MADPKAVVQVSDHVRFTVLTSSLIRIERAIGSDGFQDEQTMVVFNRRLPVPKFSVSKVGSNGIQIETSSLVLTFFGDGSHDEFSAKNLQVEMKTAIFSTFQPGNMAIVLPEISLGHLGPTTR